MKKTYWTATIVLLAVLGALAGEIRTWKNNVGGSIEAEFVKEKSGTVYLRTADGKVKSIKMTSLSEEDQKIAKSLASPFPEKAAVATAPKANEALLELFSTRLRTTKDKKVSTGSLEGKVIGIYFSAHWCPPCRAFTPKLVQFHEDMAKQEKPFEVVFVSSDRSSTKMFDYIEEEEMPWLIVPFGNDVGKKLKKKYEVSGIPRLVIIDSKGNILSENAVGTISSKGAEAYDQWKPKS